MEKRAPVFVAKKQKAEGVSLSYRPLCHYFLNDERKKIIVRILNQRTETHLAEGGLADIQYDFCKGKLTHDVTLKVNKLQNRSAKLP